MKYRVFATYNVLGAALWVGIFTYAGYYFGGLPFVEKNFKYVILAIIIISILPALFEVWKARREGQRERTA